MTTPAPTLRAVRTPVAEHTALTVPTPVAEHTALTVPTPVAEHGIWCRARQAGLPDSAPEAVLAGGWGA